MAELFNPYHIWLGIPPQEQPANHYRLLSIQLFEASADAIDSAADRQMAHLRTFQTGKHGDLTQRLLNEVSAARICLLDPKNRAAYDQQLRATLPATTAVAPEANALAAGGSAIQRQPPRRATAGAPMAMPTATPLSTPVAAAAPQAADPWNDLLGDPNVKAASRPASNSAKTAAAKRSANNRTIPLAIVGGLVLAAVVGFVALSLGGSSDGTLVFDWPAADRANTTVKVDGTLLAVPASGPWEFSCPPGSHHIIADHLAYKLDAKVDVAAGQKQTVPPDWKAKATLVLNWPPALRSGAELRIDNHVQTISQREPMEVAVEPGRRQIQITRPGFDPIHTTATVAADSRELVSIAAPPTTAKLAFDWPAADRKDAELIVDGKSQAVGADSDSAPFELTLSPGRHVIHINRTGYEPFNEAIDLAAGAESSIKPSWTPEQKAAPTVAETQPPAAETVAQPVKKLAVPAAAEQERITKQLESLYKISKSDAKDAAKAQELYDVAAKDGSTPAERYMLLLKGAEVAAVAGDLNLSLSGIDALDADFKISALELKQKLLEKFIAAGKPDQVAIAIPAAEQLVDQAVAADQYEIALVLATTASHAATKSKIAARKEVEERLTRRRHNIHVIEPLYAAAKKAQEALDKNPADAETNLAVGRWDCFYKGDWTNGLPLLAKGSDDKLKSLAAEELKASTDAEEQAHLADGWWDMAQKEAGQARDSIHLHAGDIYKTAMPNLASALKKAAIEKRLTEIADVKPIEAPIAADRHASISGATWFPLQVQSADSTAGAALSEEPNGVVFASGKTDKDTYTVVARTRLRGITAFRVEALADPRLPGNGPGHGDNGNCVLSEFRASAASLSDSSNPQRVTLTRALADFGQEGLPVSAAIDGDLATGWAVHPQEGRNHVAIFECKDDVGFASGTLLTFSLDQDYGNGYTLGKFRLSATTAKRPVQLGLLLADGYAQGTAAVKLPLNKWVDVLRLVNPNENTIRGAWSWHRTDLQCEGTGKCRIDVPVAAVGSYDLEADFTRTKGTDDIHVIFPVGADECNAVFSAENGQYSCLYSLDRHVASDSPILTRPGSIENGRRYRLHIEVRVEDEHSATIDVSLDGKPYLPHWQGSPDSWSAELGWSPSSFLHFGLAQLHDQVIFHSLRLRMLSGQATVDAPLTPEPGNPNIVSARWGAGDGWEDVTQRVRSVLAHGWPVFARTDFFDSDPAPGAGKRLEIEYERAGKKGTAAIDENRSWMKAVYENLQP